MALISQNEVSKSWATLLDMVKVLDLFYLVDCDRLRSMIDGKRAHTATTRLHHRVSSSKLTYAIKKFPSVCPTNVTLWYTFYIRIRDST
jgi:hypothetical protein